jgi:hypothetical protein
VSERSQQFIIWWGVVFTVIYGAALCFLLHMMPPPKATLSAAQIQAFYTEHHDSIRLGAIVASWCSAFMVPLFAVITVQMARVEEGKIWTVMCAFGGALMSIFLVLPPLFWGVAAYTTDRAPGVTALMHELGTLTLTTTDQFYIFAWVAIVVICFRGTTLPYSPFSRRYGYFTAWSAFMFEAGAIAFVPRTGPFAWRGILVYWSPLTIFGAWITVTCVVFLKAIKEQRLSATAATPEVALA